MEKQVVTVGISMVSFLFGGWSLMLTILLVLNILDYVTGIVSAFLNGEVKSDKGYRGIAKKMMIWVWIVVANFLDIVLKEQGYNMGELLINVVAIWYIINEVVSLGENSVKLGVELPVPIAKGLDIFKNKIEEQTKA